MNFWVIVLLSWFHQSTSSILLLLYHLSLLHCYNNSWRICILYSLLHFSHNHVLYHYQSKMLHGMIFQSYRQNSSPILHISVQLQSFHFRVLVNENQSWLLDWTKIRSVFSGILISNNYNFISNSPEESTEHPGWLLLHLVFFPIFVLDVKHSACGADFWPLNSHSQQSNDVTIRIKYRFNGNWWFGVLNCHFTLFRNYQDRKTDLTLCYRW